MRNPRQQGLQVLEKKHPLAIRWFHWINFPVMAVMVWSGLLIFWANREGAITAFGRQIFPNWFYAPPVAAWVPKWFPTVASDSDHPNQRQFYSLGFRLAEGMGWHFTFMWLFAINGALYVGYLVFSGQWRVIVPGLKSFYRAVLVALSDLYLVRKPSQKGVYNDAQRIAYTTVIFLGLVMLVTGFAIYKPTQAYWLTALFGGYVMARWFHFWTTMLLVGFFFVHVAQVIRAGWNNFRGMITGFGLERVAEVSHPLPEIEPPQVGSQEVA